MFSLFNFLSIFPGGQLTPFAPMCGRPWSYPRNYTSDLHQIFARVTYGRGSVLLWRRSDTLCTSGFMDDVIFAHLPSCSTSLPRWSAVHTQPWSSLYKYQLSLIDPCDKIVLQTELDDLCDKLVVERRRYYRLSWPTTVQFITLWTSTFLELSW